MTPHLRHPRSGAPRQNAHERQALQQAGEGFAVVAAPRQHRLIQPGKEADEGELAK